MGKLCEKINLIKAFEIAIRSHIRVIFGDCTIDFASETNWGNGHLLKVLKQSSWLNSQNEKSKHDQAELNLPV